MKNKLKTLSVILVVMLITITSCKKDNLQQAGFTDNNTAYANMIVNRIDNFRTQMNSTERSGDMMLLDTAIWNLEALITYDKAYPDSASKDFKTLKSYYTLTLDANNMVTEAEVQQVYNLMLDTLNYQLSLLDDDVKFAVFSDVELVEIEGNTASITVINGFGTGYILGLYYPFADDDDWIWGTLGGPLAGKCDGTEIGVSDGSNELQYRLNHPIMLPGNTSYTDLVTIPADGFLFEDDNGYARIFVGWDYPNNECLTNDTLTYFLIEADDIVKTYEADGGLRPPDKDFVRIYILDELVMSSPQSWHIHQYWVTFGTPYDNHGN